jgi:hypothetical protein
VTDHLLATLKSASASGRTSAPVAAIVCNILLLASPHQPPGGCLCFFTKSQCSSGLIFFFFFRSVATAENKIWLSACWAAYLDDCLGDRVWATSADNAAFVMALQGTVSDTLSPSVTQPQPSSTGSPVLLASSPAVVTRQSTRSTDAAQDSMVVDEWDLEEEVTPAPAKTSTQQQPTASPLRTTVTAPTKPTQPHNVDEWDLEEEVTPVPAKTSTQQQPTASPLRTAVTAPNKPTQPHNVDEWDLEEEVTPAPAKTSTQQQPTASPLRTAVTAPTKPTQLHVDIDIGIDIDDDWDLEENVAVVATKVPDASPLHVQAEAGLLLFDFASVLYLS